MGFKRMKSNSSNSSTGPIKIDKLFSDENGEKKLLPLPSGKVKPGRNKKKRRCLKGSRKTIRRDVTVVFDELMKEIEPIEDDISSDSLEFPPEWDMPQSLELGTEDYNHSLSLTSKKELKEIYEAIDELNRLCIEPIKVKLKRDYIKIKKSNDDPNNCLNDKVNVGEDLRYSADINIVLSSRNKNETKANPEETGTNDFSLTVEPASDNSISEECCGQNSCVTNNSDLQISHFSSDSVRTLENSENNDLTNKEPVSDEDLSNNPDKAEDHGYNSSSTGNWGVELDDNNNPIYSRTLFYRFYEPFTEYDYNFNSSNQHSFNPPYTKCSSPSKLGFDSVESLNNSLNAPCEIIIKPPVSIGRSISFRSNVCKSVLSKDRFISGTVFQINWFNPRRKKSRSFLTCCT
uniref:Uncharacterized protein n=1 Tax=Theileria annulata TaxID=5874 RepID=A0A3B0N229_THEAN